MSPAVAGGMGIAAMIALLGLRVPIGAALTLAGLGGYLVLAKPAAVMHVLGSTVLQVGSEYTLSVVPLFVLMGAVALRAGMSERLFSAASALFGRVRGAEPMAVIAASAAFGAVSGSSLATTATIARVAGTELRQRGYHDSIIGGSIAAGGTLGILIPPSVVLVVYALITGQSVAALFAAGIVPGIILSTLYLLATAAIVARGSDSALLRREVLVGRLRLIAKGWEVVVLFGLTIGGIYAGWFTPTEAAAIGAVLAIVLGFVFGNLTIAGFIDAMRETVITTAALFFVVLGATFFAYFVIQARLPPTFIAAIEAWNLSGITVILAILAFYLVAGCFLDGLGMMLATVPIFFPVIVALGYDPVWFGILVVIAIEVGLITPPVGMNLFVIKAQIPDLALTSIYAGILPFLVAQSLMLAIMLALPGVATWLPGLLFP